MQDIAEKPLEELDSQELQSLVKQYLAALESALQAVQNKSVADKKGKGLAEGGEWQ